MIGYKNKKVARLSVPQVIGSLGARLALLAFCSLLLALNPTQSFALEVKPGETIVYDIKKMVKVGQATLIYRGIETVENQNLIHIIVTTDAFNFYDQEDLYLQPNTFYPILVKRDLNIFGKKEKITEYYDQEKGSVRIVKIAGGKTTEQVINKVAPIENLYGFIYKFRLNGDVKNSKSVTLHLPTKDVEMKNLGSVKVKASRKSYQTVLLQSLPKQYSVWFDTQGNNLPVKIDGGLGATQAVMILREVKK